MAAAGDGPLLACLTFDNGAPIANTDMLRRLGISREILRDLVKSGTASGGVMDASHLSAFPNPKAVASRLAEKQLSIIITAFTKCCVSDPATIALALGYGLPQDVGLSVRRSEAELAAIDAVVASASPAITACKASCTGALISSFKNLWPILESISASYSDQPSFLWKVGDLFNAFFDVSTESAPLESILSFLPDMLQASKVLNAASQGEGTFMRFARKVIQAVPSTNAGLPDMWTASSEMLQTVVHRVKTSEDAVGLINGQLAEDAADIFALATALLRKEPDAFLQLPNLQDIVNVSKDEEYEAAC